MRLSEGRLRGEVTAEDTDDDDIELDAGAGARGREVDGTGADFLVALGGGGSSTSSSSDEVYCALSLRASLFSRSFLLATSLSRAVLVPLTPDGRASRLDVVEDELIAFFVVEARGVPLIL